MKHANGDETDQGPNSPPQIDIPFSPQVLKGLTSEMVSPIMPTENSGKSYVLYIAFIVFLIIWAFARDWLAWFWGMGTVRGFAIPVIIAAFIAAIWRWWYPKDPRNVTSKE